MGYRGIANAGEDLWLIETPGLRSSVDRLANFESQIDPRPLRARIVGVVRFEADGPYADEEAFDEDPHHCIALEGPYRWTGAPRFWWKVERVQRIQMPIDDPPKSMAGMRRTAHEVNFQ